MKFNLTVLLLLFSLVAFAQEGTPKEIDWDLVNDKDGLKVFTRTTESSSIKELRILADFEGQIDTLLTILNDANYYTTWVYKCANSCSIIPSEGFNTAYAATTDLPFPMSDRELVANSTNWVDAEGRIIQHTVSTADAIPPKSGIVRIQDYEAKWIIEQTDMNKIHIEYTSSVDPGGNIPAWIVNLAITTGPIKTFEELMKQVKEKSPVLEVSSYR